jgi:hypothetical protein
LRSFSNGSCIFSGQSTNFVATIASVGKIFLMILAVEVFGLPLVAALARQKAGIEAAKAHAESPTCRNDPGISIDRGGP